jgi:hypothetical protein
MKEQNLFKFSKEAYECPFSGLLDQDVIILPATQHSIASNFYSLPFLLPSHPEAKSCFTQATPSNSKKSTVIPIRFSSEM